MTHCPHNRIRAFTLIELMVVITLIAIMSAVIVPQMKGTYEDALLRAAGREMTSVFNLASSRAIGANQVHRVRLDFALGRYVIERCAHQRGSKMEFVSAPEILENLGKLDPRVKVEILPPQASAPDPEEALEAKEDLDEAELQEQSTTVRFYPDGSADARQIILTDRAGIRAAFRVNPVNGRVRPFDLDTQPEP